MLAIWVGIAGIPVDCLAAQTAPSSGDHALPVDFVVRTGDLLRIRVWPESELSGEYPVEDTGEVFLPMLGGVAVAGSTLQEIRVMLRDLFAGSMRSPVVSITPSFPVSVLGSVLRPGLYRLEGTQTVFDAISLAGGFRDDAKQDEITVFRGGMTYDFNADLAIETGEADFALNLQSGDRIIVPRTLFGWQDIVSINSILTVLQSVAVIVTLGR